MSLTTQTTVPVRSPLDGAALGALALLGPDDVREVAARLREAQQPWHELGLAGRSGWLRRYRSWLLAHRRELADLVHRETGKPRREAAMLEVTYPIHAIDHVLRAAPAVLQPSAPPARSLLALPRGRRLSHEPYPLVGVISPWNFPLALALVDAAPALLAGAAVMVKPSELTPLAVVRAVEGWAEIGAPPVLAAVTGDSSTGEAVVGTVDMVQFTGSVATGRRVAAAAAHRLVPAGLELGGKDAMIVLDDADLCRAARAAVWGAMANAGQMCTSVERVYVERRVERAFLDLVVAEVARLRTWRPGCGDDYEIGPLVSPGQADLVQAHLDDALARGARVLVGGGRRGDVIEPTVLVDVDHTMRCLHEETFGPLLPVIGVAGEDEAVARANDSAYGLSASVFGSPERAQRVADRLCVGAANVNDVFGNLYALSLPQAGWGGSGLGGRNGDHGLLRYTRPKVVVTARVPLPREPMWFPYTRPRTTVVDVVSRAVSALSAARR